MAAKKAIVKIERGQYSSSFQVTRAWLSAASALAAVKPMAAVTFINAAITELTDLRDSLLP